jgi:hypothetical protein
MDQESNRKLRLDRRLVRRRGWIAPSDLEAALESLPDASGKVAPPESEETVGSAATAPAEEPAPVGGAATEPPPPFGGGTPEGGAPV